MIILGIHSHSHDAGAAIWHDGRIFAISEERLTRKKHDGSFPKNAISYVMNACGLTQDCDVDLAVFDTLGHNESTVRACLSETGIRNILPVGHHEAHAASAFFCSPFDRAAVFVCDAWGSFSDEIAATASTHHAFSREMHSTYIGEGTKISQVLKTYSQPGRATGIGAMYCIASFLSGFSELEAGKVMALASFGTRDDVFPDCVFTEDHGHFAAWGDPEHDPVNPAHIAEYSGRFFRGISPRKHDEPIRLIHCELARAAQEACAAAALNIASRLYDNTGCPSLCVAGGFGLNCHTNSRYAAETPFTEIFIQPAATDAGIPLGCALYGAHIASGVPFSPSVFDPYLGRSYSDDEILAAVREFDSIVCEERNDIVCVAAEQVAEGAIGGWMQGASEYGPRALGNRSIIADPRRPGTKPRLDSQIKLREDFRPYAPVTTVGRAADFFAGPATSPYMLHLFRVLPHVKTSLPAVTHFDGTTRLQTVSESENQRLHELISRFGEITGIPVLLNTSFNRKSEPIVETPRDAIACFLDSGLDFLAIENYYITRKHI